MGPHETARMPVSSSGTPAATLPAADRATSPLRRALALLLLLSPLIMLGMLLPLLPPYAVRVIDNLLLYAVLAIGLNIVVGYAGLLDLGYIAFYAIGAYAYAFLASEHFGLHWSLPAVLAVGVATAAFAGVLLGFPVLRLRGDYLAIVTLGFGEVVRLLLNNLDTLTNGPQGIMRIDPPVLFGVAIVSPHAFFYVFAALLVVVGWAVHRLEDSSLGISWRAIREDQDAAAGLGINVSGTKLIAFGLAASIAGACGVFFAAQQRYVEPGSFVFWESLVIVLIVVVGGVGNILGMVLGAAVFVAGPELLREHADARMLIYGMCLIVVILLRPDGLLPRRYGIGWLLGKLGWL